MSILKHKTMEELEAGLAIVHQSAQDEGVLYMIVRRPEVGMRETIDEAELDPLLGLIGDNWYTRGSSRTADGSAHPDAQLTVMNSRLITLIAREQAQWPLAGDQLFVDMDLSMSNLPPGTRLSLGSAVIEVTAKPHTGCQKFTERFGRDALIFVNSPLGKQLRLRGMNTKVIQGGVIRVGDMVQKV